MTRRGGGADEGERLKTASEAEFVLKRLRLTNVVELEISPILMCGTDNSKMQELKHVHARSGALHPKHVKRHKGIRITCRAEERRGHSKADFGTTRARSKTKIGRSLHQEFSSYSAAPRVLQ